MKNTLPPKWIDTRLRKRKFNDLSGNKFGRLTVLYRSIDEKMSNGNKTPRYACKCDCGNIVLVRATSLKNGHTSSCKRCNRSESLKNKNLKDLSGLKINRWTVLKRAPNVLEPSGKFATMWTCKCDCGTLKNIRASTLKSGISHSCGCYKHDSLTVKRKLYDKQFGLWKVISKKPIVKKSNVNNRWQYMWLCECQCNYKTQRYVSEQSLIGLKSTSCGCVSESLLEQYTINILNEYHIDYKKQLTFNDLRGLKNGLLSYDFGLYINNKLICLIECQGMQHYKPCDYFGGLNQFKVQLEHDKLKRNYANKLGIDFYEIEYKDRFNIRSKIVNILNYYNLTKNNK